MFLQAGQVRHFPRLKPEAARASDGGGMVTSLWVRRLVLQRHVRQLSMAQVVIFQELKSFLRISIRTWLMDQNPCETSHFLTIGVLTER